MGGVSFNSAAISETEIREAQIAAAQAITKILRPLIIIFGLATAALLLWVPLGFAVSCAFITLMVFCFQQYAVVRWTGEKNILGLQEATIGTVGSF